MIRIEMRLAAMAVIAAVLLGGAGSAPAADLFLETFSDDVLEPGAATNFATIAGGIASFEDASTTSKARLSVVQDFTAPVMTFAFDVVAPITRTEPASNELMIRAGVGTGADMMGSGDQIVEAILYRDGNRGAFLNNGNESIFLVANNKDTDLVFPSPIDGTDVTLLPFQYVPYVRDNGTGLYGLIKGISNMADRNGADPGVGTISRFAIGNGNNGYLGTFAFDNARVLDVVYLPNSSVIPEPSTAVLFSLASLLVLGWRRR